jgi:hypothetical protein
MYQGMVMEKRQARRTMKRRLRTMGTEKIVRFRERGCGSMCVR